MRFRTGLVLTFALLPVACGAARHESAASPAHAAEPAEPGPSAPPSAEESLADGAGDEEGRARSGATREGESAESFVQLERASTDFEGALQPEALSCSGAREHLDAICHLAERICTSSEREPSSGARLDCSEARQRCTSAKARFARSCSAEP